MQFFLAGAEPSPEEQAANDKTNNTASIIVSNLFILNLTSTNTFTKNYIYVYIYFFNNTACVFYLLYSL